jgi:hypothetical protein
MATIHECHVELGPTYNCTQIVFILLELRNWRRKEHPLQS